LDLRSESAPWWLKRRIRKRIEKELYAELPKPPKSHDAERPNATNHEPKDGSRKDLKASGEKGSSERELESKKYQHREFAARALFFRKRRHPDEVKQYDAWKEAFYALTRRWTDGSRESLPPSGDKKEGLDGLPTTDSQHVPSAAAEDVGNSEASTAYYSKVGDELSELFALGDEEAVREKWRRQTLEDRAASWPRLVLATLASSPRSACLFLRATWEAHVCPIYVVHDAVWFLIRRPAVLQSEAAARDLCDLVIFLLQHARQEGFQTRQWDIYKIMSNVSSDEAVHELYRQLVISQHPLHRYTRLQFAKRFGESAVFKPTAFEILEYLVQAKELDVNSPHAAALCTTILTPSKKALEESFDPGQFVEGTEVSEMTTRYSERLLQLGFNPNLITYSVLIRDLLQRKEVKTALDVHKIMASQELKPDALLYSFLLNGAKTSHSWLPMHMLVQQAFLDEIKDPVVWNELLHTVFLAYLGEARRQRGRRRPGLPAFHPMLKLYANIFQQDLLRKFIPADVDYLANADLHVSNLWECEKQVFLLAYRTPSWSSRGMLEPGYDTLTLMILGYINSLSNPQSVLDFYLHFRKLLDRGDRYARYLVAKGGTRIYDYVLRALLQWREHLGTCVGLVSDMLEISGQSPVKNEPLKVLASLRQPSGASAAAAAASVSRKPVSVGDPPSESLMLPQAVSGRPDTARPSKASGLASGRLTPEESFRHPPPSVHTWSILINGLMFHREADKAERVMEIMRENGVEPSLVTYNTLIAGYANAQNVRKTVKTLERLEGAGLEGDDFTFKAWAYLTDKESALELMEGAEAERTKRVLLLRQQSDEQAELPLAATEKTSPGMFGAELEAWEAADSR
jgi:pentatricopeptide repeat protein